MTPLEEIAAERKRQVESEGWSAEHDDKHDHGEMRNAAAAYAMTPSARQIPMSRYHGDTIRERIWPWSREWWKPKDHRRDLVRAGALIVAEIERLNRRSLRGETAGRLVYDKEQRTIVRDGEPLGISIEDTPLA